MFKEILNLFKSPLLEMQKHSKEKNMKNSLIKTAILAGILTFINLLSNMLSAIITKELVWTKGNYVTSIEFSNLKDVEYINVIFKGYLINFCVIAAIAGILLLIALILKNKKEYIEYLSIANDATIIYIAGAILNLILFKMFFPLAIAVSFFAILYAFICAYTVFAETIEISDFNKFNLLITGGALIIGIALYLVLKDEIIGYLSIELMGNLFQ